MSESQSTGDDRTDGFDSATRAAQLAPLAFLALLGVLSVVQMPRAVDLDVLFFCSIAVIPLALLALLGLVRCRATTLHLPRRIAVLGGLFVSSAITSWILSPASTTALPRCLSYVALVLISVVAYVVHRDTGRGLMPWLSVIALAVVILVSIGLVDMLLNPSADPYWTVGLFHNARRMGGLALVGATACAGISLLDPRRRGLAFGGILFLLFATVVSGARGPLLVWLFFVGSIIVLRGDDAPGRRRAFLADTLGAFVIASLLAVTLDASGLWETDNAFQRAATSGGSADEISSGRVELWQSAIAQIQDAPLMGRGPDAFAFAGPEHPVAHPHNWVLQMFLEFGVVGCLLLGLLTAQAVALAGGRRVLLRSCRATMSARILTAMLLAQLLLGLIDGPLYWFFPLVVFAVLMGLWLALIADGRKR